MASLSSHAGLTVRHRKEEVVVVGDLTVDQRLDVENPRWAAAIRKE